jgi:hypothetical protein
MEDYPIGWASNFNFGRKNDRVQRHGVSNRSAIMPYTLNGKTVLPCSTCGHVRPIEEFSVDAQRAAGYRPCCKSCDHERYENRKKAAHGTSR